RVSDRLLERGWDDIPVRRRARQSGGGHRPGGRPLLGARREAVAADSHLLSNWGLRPTGATVRRTGPHALGQGRRPAGSGGHALPMGCGHRLAPGVGPVSGARHPRPRASLAGWESAARRTARRAGRDRCGRDRRDLGVCPQAHSRLMEGPLVALWLCKQEPSCYSFDDLVRDGGTVWDDSSNALARKHLGEMKPGDRVFFYHTGKEKAVVGEMVVASEPRQYPNADDEAAVAVDMKPVRKLLRPVSLAEIKADERLATWDL